MRSSSERNKGLSVTAEGQIVVYGLDYTGFTSDVFLVLPCDRLPVDQYEYYAVIYDSPYVVIVGCENDTVVQVSDQSIVLNKMETYLFESYNYNRRSVRIVTNQPIAVFSGNKCDYHSSLSSRYVIYFLYCETKQVLPTAVWGKSFMSASLAGKSSKDSYYIVSSENDTTVTVNCTTFNTLSYTLNTAGSFWQFSIPEMSFCSIISDKPIIMQLVQERVKILRTIKYEFIYIDKFMMTITPVEHYSNIFLIAIPEFPSNFITLYVTSKYYQPQEIFVDDANLESANWTTVNCSNTTKYGHITYVSLTPGRHHVYHSNPSARVGVFCAWFLWLQILWLSWRRSIYAM